MKNKQLNNVKLSKEQVDIVKEMIIHSFESIYREEDGKMSNKDLRSISNSKADKIIKNTQMALIQNAVYSKAVKNSKPLKK